VVETFESPARSARSNIEIAESPEAEGCNPELDLGCESGAFVCHLSEHTPFRLEERDLLPGAILERLQALLLGVVRNFSYTNTYISGL
jgi:hypothetical protein